MVWPWLIPALCASAWWRTVADLLRFSSKADVAAGLKGLKSDGVIFSFGPKLGGMLGQVPLTSKIARIKSLVTRLVRRGATRCGHRGLECY